MNTAHWECIKIGSEWAFRLVASNGQVLMVSNKTYRKLSHAQNSLLVAKNLAQQKLITTVRKTG